MGQDRAHPPLHPDTLLVHGAPKSYPYRATMPPVVLSTAFEHPSAEDMEAIFAHEQEGHVYSRLSNPTVAELEERITALCAARGTVAVASGMSAAHLALLAIAGAGDHVVAGNQLFGGTYRLLSSTLQGLGIETRWVDARNAAQLHAAITSNTRAVLVEAIANPAMVVPNFDAIREICGAARVPLIVDATLVTPLLLDTQATGCDVAIYSGSKYLAGAATVIGGLIVDTGRFPWSQARATRLGDFLRQGDSAYLNRLRRELMVGIGPALSAQAAFLQLVGLETLGLRLERQCQNAQRIAEWLLAHPAVSSVAYPGLPDHPDHGNCLRYFRGHFGSMLGFNLASRAACFRFLNSLSLVRRAANLGDTKSLAVHPASTIYHGYWPAQREELGVPETLIRLSVGIEDSEDLLADLDHALSG